MAISRNDIELLLDDVYDPELGLRIIDLGLIYRIDTKEEGLVEVDFTLTYPGCPAADVIYENIEHKLQGHPEIKKTNINIVFEPPWTPDKMTEEARLMLGYPI